MSNAPTIQRIVTPDDADMDRLISLYEAAIPYEERKPSDAIRMMTRSPVHVVAVAKRQAEIAGFSLLFCGSSVAMLEYLAVADHVQGSGIGSFLYRSAREAVGARPLIVEIESPYSGASPDEQKLRVRRLEFYRRMGCRLIRDIDYVLPLATADRAPPIALLLDNVQSDTIPAETIGQWLEEVYVHVYGCAADDPRLIRTVTALPELVPLG